MARLVVFYHVVLVIQEIQRAVTDSAESVQFGDWVHGHKQRVTNFRRFRSIGTNRISKCHIDMPATTGARVGVVSMADSGILTYPSGSFLIQYLCGDDENPKVCLEQSSTFVSIAFFFTFHGRSLRTPCVYGTYRTTFHVLKLHVPLFMVGNHYTNVCGF